jgi:hypothetical protein
VLSSEVLVTVKVWLDVLRALVQLLGPSKERFTKALQVFPLMTSPFAALTASMMSHTFPAFPYGFLCSSM